jgi:hypothetical protein
LRVTNRAGLTGCNTEYDIRIQHWEIPYVYLPIVMDNHGATSMGRDDARPRLDEGVENAVATNATGEPTPNGMLAPSGIISHTCADAYEIDDSWEHAQPITKVMQTHSFDSDPQTYAADKDYVSFDVSAGRTITFSVTVVTGTQTLLELFSEGGAALDVTGTTQLVWTPQNYRHYYLSVTPQRGTSAFGCINEAGYRLQLEMQDIAILYLPVVIRFP